MYHTAVIHPLQHFEREESGLLHKQWHPNCRKPCQTQDQYWEAARSEC